MLIQSGIELLSTKVNSQWAESKTAAMCLLKGRELGTGSYQHRKKTHYIAYIKKQLQVTHKTAYSINGSKCNTMKSLSVENLLLYIFWPPSHENKQQLLFSFSNIKHFQQAGPQIGGSNSNIRRQ